MRTFNISEAKAHLSRLVDEAEKGKPFIIAKAGKPKVKVVPIEKITKRRLGFMKGMFTVPDDIKTSFAAEIEEMFYGGEIFPPEGESEEPESEEGPNKG